MDMKKFFGLLDFMTPAQLREANAEICKRIGETAMPEPVAPVVPVEPFVPWAPTHKPPARPATSFKIGDLVEFYGKGRTVRIQVERINPKTLGGHEPGLRHMRWRVSPSLCRLVGADKPTKVEPHPLVPALPSALPTAVGAGGW